MLTLPLAVGFIDLIVAEFISRKKSTLAVLCRVILSQESAKCTHSASEGLNPGFKTYGGLLGSDCKPSISMGLINRKKTPSQAPKKLTSAVKYQNPTPQK